MRSLSVCLLALATGCFVDLSREEGLLQLVVENPSDAATAARVRVTSRAEDRLGLEPWSADLPLEPGDAPERFDLPELSTAAGLHEIRISTVDAHGAEADAIRVVEVGVDAEDETVVVFDFASAEFEAGMGTVEEVLVAEARPDSWGREGERHVAILPVDGAALDRLLSSAERHLAAVPTELRLQSLRLEVVPVVAEEPDDDDGLVLDDIWQDAVTVLVRDAAGRSETSVGSIVPGSSPSAAVTLHAGAVDVSGWLGPDASPEIVFVGLTQDEGFPFVWRARLTLRVH